MRQHLARSKGELGRKPQQRNAHDPAKNRHNKKSTLSSRC